MIAERGLRAYRLLQRLLKLTRSHPRERVEWASGHTLGYRMFRYGILRRLLEQAAAQAPVATLLHEHAWTARPPTAKPAHAQIENVLPSCDRHVAEVAGILV
ncbi:MAG: hypothetical protein JO023_20225 [Chloroflexi bacterium]|nr:hypothetical protein [Chloroflexota bacterium]